MQTFITRDGTVLAYRRSGAGPPLILVHGTASDSTRWGPLLPLLENCFCVHALDRRGYGRSGDAASYAIESEFDDIASLAAHIDDGPVDVVAHSYGALCALGAALTGRIRRLVIYEPPLPVHPGDYYKWSLITIMREAIRRNDPSAAVAAFMAEVLDVGPADIEAARRFESWTKMVGHAARIFRELENVERFIGRADFFRSCGAPTLLLVGADSPPQYMATARALDAVLPSSRIAVLKGQRHSAIGTAPELVAKEVTSFLLAANSLFQAE
jgi:pimeloyl-ACP methyl ester carboxylesterase